MYCNVDQMNHKCFEHISLHTLGWGEIRFWVEVKVFCQLSCNPQF